MSVPQTERFDRRVRSTFVGNDPMETVLQLLVTLTFAIVLPNLRNVGRSRKSS